MENKNSRRHARPIKLERPPIPLTPPGHEGTGNPLYDLQQKYGRLDLNDPAVRAKVRRDTKGQVDVRLVNGEWNLFATGNLK